MPSGIVFRSHVDHRRCKSFSELQSEIDRYIHYYNNHRYQWGLKKDDSHSIRGIIFYRLRKF
ncbi:IS3 family transposase [Paenibacillus macquariensis]